MDILEEAIWKKLQKKDLETFERYYREHYKSFFLIACKYLKDSLQAEEIVNDVFLKIWEDGKNIVIESSLKSYLYKAVINRCINTLNKNKRESDHRSDINLFRDEGYEMQLIEENELKIKLFAAIDQLPDQCRKVFEMSRFDELKQQEIADKLGISIKTVKNHITIALKQLGKVILSFMLTVVLFFISD